MTIATEPELQELAPGVFAYIQPEGGWCVSNAGLIVGGGNSVLIDTVATESRALRLSDAVTKVAGPPGVIVNTHHHGDHVFGNAMFAPPAMVVANEKTRAEVIQSGHGLRQLWPDVDWGDLPLVPPNLTFSESLTMYVADLRVELLNIGPAHTASDTVVWVPDRSVLFTGDVVMSGFTPFCLMGSIAGSLAAVERLRQFGAQTIVSGHGAVSGPEIFDVNESYLRWILQLAKDASAAGSTPLQAAREADLREFARLGDSERLVGNLHRAFQEIAGGELAAPIDVIAGFREMVDYHGRLPDCHA